MTPLAHFVRQRLHRRIFVWFGASILLTALVGSLVASVNSSGHAGFHEGYAHVRRFIGGQFAVVWDDAARRDALAQAAFRDLGVDITLDDAQGNAFLSYGAPCRRGELRAPVTRGGAVLGEVHICGSPFHGSGRWPFFAVMFAVGSTLWAASGLIARRLTRPLGELVRVANDIGQGRLDTRVTLRRSRYGEIAILADAINDMATRIQKQMRDQRELLAAVSHEIRSPLSRMRLLLELARDSREKNALSQQLDGMERELIEINELTGKLLASSRLDFSALETRELDAAALALGALERAGLPATLLQSSGAVRIAGDPTLLSRALSNLLENAVKYGGGPSELRVSAQGGQAEFSVRDRGPGFKEAELPNVFESFVRGEASSGAGSLGLGLALVRRIALAHGGRVWARNGEPIGAEVGFSVPLA